MRIIRFDPDVSGRELTAFGSSGVLFSVLARSSGEGQSICFQVEPGGGIGRHPAAVPQLFVVVEGDGWVKAGEEEARVEAGQAVLWEAGEDHESGAGPNGMTVIVLEAENIKDSAAAT